MQLTNEEIKNILVLISRANVTGAEALAVAQVQQKLNSMAAETEMPVIQAEPKPKKNA